MPVHISNPFIAMIYYVIVFESPSYNFTKELLFQYLDSTINSPMLKFNLLTFCIVIFNEYFIIFLQN